MDVLVLTRFNNETWKENVKWREKNNYTGCIYNSPVRIAAHIPLLKTIYVIEMNNDTNEILGVGKITNNVYRDKPYKIYTDNNYNRYTYKGNQRVDMKNIKSFDQKEKLQERLFKHKTHLKRGQGLTQPPVNLIHTYSRFIKSLFDSI